MKKIITLLLLLVGGITQMSADTYQVAGDATLFGDSWTAHELSDDDGDGIYTYSTTATLAANTNYEYKFKTNGGYWDGNNLKFTVQAAGTYKITFEINTSTWATNAWGILKPSSVIFVGSGVTSDTWASTETDFTADGDSWVFTIDETTANGVFFRFKLDGTEYQPYNGENDYTFNFTNGMDYSIKSWSSFQGSDKAFNLPSFSSTSYNRYVVRITPYYDNIYMEVSAYEKSSTNASGYATFVNTNPLTISDATAYYATDNNNGSATAVAITNPAASTPMLIKGTASTTYYFEVAASGETPASNAFKAGTGSAVASENGGYNYILNGDTFYAANGKIVATGKAYLQLSKKAAARALIFEDEDVTGISTIDNSQMAIDNYYNLGGQRVAQPTKGLYIVNGKKVVIR